MGRAKNLFPLYMTERRPDNQDSFSDLFGIRRGLVAGSTAEEAHKAFLEINENENWAPAIRLLIASDWHSSEDLKELMFRLSSYLTEDVLAESVANGESLIKTLGGLRFGSSGVEVQLVPDPITFQNETRLFILPELSHFLLTAHEADINDLKRLTRPIIQAHVDQATAGYIRGGGSAYLESLLGTAEYEQLEDKVIKATHLHPNSAQLAPLLVQSISGPVIKNLDMLLEELSPYSKSLRSFIPLPEDGWATIRQAFAKQLAQAAIANYNQQLHKPFS